MATSLVAHRGLQRNARCGSSGNYARATPRSATLRTVATTCRQACGATGFATSVAGIVERGNGGYRLTSDGRELMKLLRPLGQWSQRWAARTHAADSEPSRSSNEEVQ